MVYTFMLIYSSLLTAISIIWILSSVWSGLKLALDLSPSVAASAFTLHISSMTLKLYGSDKKAVDTNTDRSSVQHSASKSDRGTRMAQINSFTACTAHWKTVQTVTVMEKAVNLQKCNKRKKNTKLNSGWSVQRLSIFSKSRRYLGKTYWKN